MGGRSELNTKGRRKPLPRTISNLARTNFQPSVKLFWRTSSGASRQAQKKEHHGELEPWCLMKCDGQFGTVALYYFGKNSPHSSVISSRLNPSLSR